MKLNEKYKKTIIELFEILSYYLLCSSSVFRFNI